MTKYTKDDCKAHGFVLDEYKMVCDSNEALSAMDAAMITTPNMGVPVEFLTYFDNKAIDVLLEKRAATEIFTEFKAGTRADLIRKFRMREGTGYTQPYSDYSNNGKADVNYNYIPREQYLFETIIEYGEQEEAETAKAKINLLSDKQTSAANVIAVDANRFYMSGVAGLENYGILNAPNLPNAVVAATGASGYTTWATKTGAEIYADIVAMMADMSTRCGGHVNMTTKYKLVVGPSIYAYLAQQNALGTETVLGMIKRSFINLEVVIAPEYDDATKKVQLIAEDIGGQKTGELAFSEKLIAGRIVPDLSSYRQKFTAGTYGAIIYRPIFITTMTGI
jgi:hypothetical protein